MQARVAEHRQALGQLGEAAMAGSSWDNSETIARNEMAREGEPPQVRWSAYRPLPNLDFRPYKWLQI